MLGGLTLGKLWHERRVTVTTCNFSQGAGQYASVIFCVLSSRLVEETSRSISALDRPRSIMAGFNMYPGEVLNKA
eukprot:5154366-Prymnesium_polylepis.1